MSITLKLVLSFASILLLISCGSGSNQPSSTASPATNSVVQTDTTPKSLSIVPKGPKPEWAQDIHPEMQAVIEKLVSYNAKPIGSLM